MDLRGYWTHRPLLVGGPEALGGAHMSQVGRSVLIHVDGTVSIERLKALVPALSQIEFALIVRDAVKRGIIELLPGS